MIEILVVMLIMAIVTAIALPSALTSLKGYRLHSDATSVSSYLNVVRMKSASQFAPYRLVVNVAAGNYIMEHLCGTTTAASDLSCTTPYKPFTVAKLDGGTQYISQGNTFSSCRPAGLTSYPGTITADPNPCPDPLYVYFNTRGSPVDNTGNPMGNGGAVLYIKNQNNLVDAITVSLGGRVEVSMWGGTGWGVR